MSLTIERLKEKIEILTEEQTTTLKGGGIITEDLVGM